VSTQCLRNVSETGGRKDNIKYTPISGIKLRTAVVKYCTSQATCNVVINMARCKPSNVSNSRWVTSQLNKQQTDLGTAQLNTVVATTQHLRVLWRKRLIRWLLSSTGSFFCHYTTLYQIKRSHELGGVDVVFWVVTPLFGGGGVNKWQ
jgi:hypothetical protein